MKDTNITEVRDKLFQNFIFIKAKKKYILLQYFFLLSHVGVSPSNQKAYSLYSAHLILVSTVSLLKASTMKLLKEMKLEHILLHSY